MNYFLFKQRIGWLDGITNWFRDAFLAMWLAFTKFMQDLVIMFIKALMDLSQFMTDNIPVPDFLTDYSICALLSQAGPLIGWAWNSLGLSECMLVLSAGYAFRMLRKVFTLFQW